MLFRSNDTATTEIYTGWYTLSLHDALPICVSSVVFDRGGYLYHGRVKALTDAARAAGLNKNEVVAEEAAAVAEPAAPEPEAKPKKARVKKEKSGKEA